jgi:hypothetical protein
VCLTDPGHEVDLLVEAPALGLITYWMGSTRWQDQVRSGEIRVAGRRDLVRAFPSWFTRSAMAGVPAASVPA